MAASLPMMMVLFGEMMDTVGQGTSATDIKG
jgi:hypothetical protein